jgi:hypothetical protein
MTPRAFETLIELEFSDKSTAEFFYQQPMTEREVHDTLDPLLEEWRGDTRRRLLSPIHVSHWNAGNIYSQRIELLSPTE